MTPRKPKTWQERMNEWRNIILFLLSTTALIGLGVGWKSKLYAWLWESEVKKTIECENKPMLAVLNKIEENTSFQWFEMAERVGEDSVAAIARRWRFYRGSGNERDGE